MKKVIISLLTAALIFGIGSVHAQSLCDLVFDFEDATVYTGNNVTIVSSVTNPYTNGINTSSKCLQVTKNGNGDNSAVVALPITIPSGLTLAQAFTSVKVQFAAVSSSLNGKNTFVGISSDGNAWSNTFSGSPNGNFATAWIEREVLISGLNANLQSKTGNVYLGVGLGAYENNTVYYMDNVTLVANPANCVTINPDEDATLIALSVNPGTLTPVFAAATTSYTVNVANEIENITIAATATQVGNGSSAISGTGIQSLNVGANTFPVIVTAPDGTTQKTYTIVVNRADENVSCNLQFDFETETYTGYNATVTSVTNPSKSGINGSNNCVQIVTSGAYNNNMVKLQITVPNGLTLAQAFETITFQLYSSSSLSGKNTYIGISNDGSTNWSFYDGNPSTTINTTWSERFVSVSSLSNTIKDKTGTFYLGVGIKTENNTTYLMDNVTLIAKEGICPITYRWTPGSSNSTDWATAANWTPNGVPGAIDKVIILPAASYPSVPAGKEIKSITFQPGTEISNQQNLTGNYKAYVQYDFSDDAAHDRWHMITVPFQEAFVGDFTFGGHPRTFFQPFGANGWEPSNTFTNDKPLTAGDAFLFQIEKATYTAGAAKGLGKKNGILEIPFHESDIVKGEGVHPNHEYDGTSTSTFYNYKKVGNEYVNSETSVAVSRSSAAYKLVGATVAYPLTFSHDEDYSADFALAGNPFMTSISIELLAAGNSNLIKNNYQIWTGQAFTGYHPLGTFGLSSAVADQYIAPLQAFFVEKSTTYDASNLSFDIATVAVSGKATLRTTGNASPKLEITADNGNAPVRTFIAQHSEGQTIVGNADARKLRNDADIIPDVYTLKSDAEGNIVALGANVVNTNNIQIPIGLLTSYSGEMNFTFTGMDTYENTIITLIDNLLQTEIDLTGLSSYQHQFTHTPATGNEGVIPDDNRFAVQFTPATPTGIVNVTSDRIIGSHYYNLQGIEIVQPVRNQIYIVKTIFESGKNEVKKRVNK